ncbi:MAG: hypothetical protein HOY75_13340 [Streptomyces sp.]|nr:hypothetical protein [Streptomyces sp.]
MTGPTSTPRGERAGQPGITWNTQLARTETVIDDPDTTTVPGLNDPQPPHQNRATRRALARAARRKNP